MDNLLLLLIFIYVALMILVGYVAYKRTVTSEDYLVAGRETNSYIMALSYGATFISTAAIVGFGGLAGTNGMGILWLVCLNIAVGIFLAFVVFGKKTRKMGQYLDALTFPEFLSKRFNSRFIQYFSGALIFCAMPIYAASVLIGAARFLETTINVDFTICIIVLAIIIGFYVIFGGLKGVMYTDALQGTIMFIGMLILLVSIYWMLGGVTEAHQALTQMAPLFPEASKATGATGWTTFPTMGSPFWWNLVSSIILGVGVGAIAQPQLAVRFMTVKSNKELNRAVLVGGIFIFVTTFTAYIVGTLSNVYFFQTSGQIAIQAAGGNVDKIIPTFINSSMPKWFTYVFMLTLLSAAMSTISTQFHVQGSSIAYDVYGGLKDSKKHNLSINRIGILIAIIIAVILAYLLPGNIVAQGTSIFFGICAAAFLPVYICALFWKRTTKEGAIAGIISGTLISLFCLIFTHQKEAAGLGIAKALTGSNVLFTSMPWPYVDPMVIALPLAFVFTVVVSLLTHNTKDEEKEIDQMFKYDDTKGDVD
ncbi:sodium:solute symporter [Methanosphaera cuniculi]|uniref:sodium:solute symporter family protein n=1 Tax=Methanosphaera cuniculi TaxID=1077256 RepID=UPI0026EF04B2|nr:sodium:solute symporter family protein [Methanosphaera cuniculi]